MTTFQHFASRDDVVQYIGNELLSSLQDDLSRMEREERRHYTDEDRQEMRNRIADVQAVIPTLR
ncbi:hypothetical protein SB861_37555 [Paraburkholderia sp. SIMBA_049]